MSHSYIEQPVTAVPAIETILWSVQKRITFSVTPTGIIRFAHDFVGLIMLLHTSGPELRCIAKDTKVMAQPIKLPWVLEI